MSNDGDDWTTLSVRTRRLKRFNNLKSKHSDDHLPDLSGDQFLKVLLDTLEAAEDGYYEDASGLTPEEVADEVASRVDMPAALSYDDVVAASEEGTRRAIEDGTHQ